VVSANHVLILGKIAVKKDFMIEDIEEQIKSVNMLLLVNRPNGEVIRLGKIVDEDEVVGTFYIPQLDISIHGSNMGETHDGTLFRRFSFFIKEDEDFLVKSILDDFLNSGWSFFYQEGIDFRKHN